MNMTAFKVSAKEVRWLTEASGFVSKKRQVTIDVVSKVSFYGTFWDGGSRNEYVAVKLDSGKAVALDTGSAPWGAIAEGKTVDLLPGYAIVEYSVFCGKEMPLRVYLHPSNVTEKLLAAKV